MVEKVHRYKNVVVIETHDEEERKSTYKQFNDNELIIYRTWEYSEDWLSKLYNDITTGYWRKTNVKKFKKEDKIIYVTHIYDSQGRSFFIRDKF